MWLAEAAIDGTRIVKQVNITEDIWVSTVFIGCLPALFETLVFGHDNKVSACRVGTMARYKTWAEAEAGHEKVVEMVRQELKEREPIAALLAEAVLSRMKE